MTDTPIYASTLQVVHTGGTPRVAAATLRVIHTGGTPRVAAATLQIVGAGYAYYVRVHDATAQVVHTGTGGGTFRAVDATVQVVRGGASASGSIDDTSGTMQVVYTTGVPTASRQRAWAFDIDGHTCYVVDLGANGALVFDITTNKWLHFETANYGGHWNMKNGMAWRGGKMVVGGDMVNGTIRRLDTDSWLDEGFRPVMSELRGALFTSGQAYHKVYALRLIGSAGTNADTVAPVLHMRFSDDQGITWSNEFTVTLVPDTRQRVEFRSLGAFANPGRIFRLYDEGGLKYIAYVVADMDS